MRVVVSRTDGTLIVVPPPLMIGHPFRVVATIITQVYGQAEINTNLAPIIKIQYLPSYTNATTIRIRLLNYMNTPIDCNFNNQEVALMFHRYDWE